MSEIGKDYTDVSNKNRASSYAPNADEAQGWNKGRVIPLHKLL